MSSQRVPGGVVHKLPADLRKVLIANGTALAAWKDITPLARNEFICWVEDAKPSTARPLAGKRPRHVHRSSLLHRRHPLQTRRPEPHASRGLRSPKIAVGAVNLGAPSWSSRRL